MHAVFYKEKGNWIAHCLEFDLVGHGTTKEDALRLLTGAIVIQIQMTIKHNNPKNLFSPADGKYFAMYAAGKDVATGKLEMQDIDSVTLEEINTREYSDSDAEPAGV